MHWLSRGEHQRVEVEGSASAATTDLAAHALPQLVAKYIHAFAADGRRSIEQEARIERSIAADADRLANPEIRNWRPYRPTMHPILHVVFEGHDLP